MKNKLSPQEMELYQRIDEILFYKWDPIGLSDSAWVRNEYQSYLPEVFKLAMKSESTDMVAAYLTAVATENMGLKQSPRHDRAIAELIMQIKKGINL
ncbi:hypothetical protein MNBD_GAMMA09-3470 [hydrothermal vent metagenome]|uniref:Uncharacterized protein n=1 Tax=hydrothermal vent metagenome TaxID=652676 RepID=A0A3B0XNC7_9ZZZZ